MKGSTDGPWPTGHQHYGSERQDGRKQRFTGSWRLLLPTLGCLWIAVGCSIFDDPAPGEVRFRVSGDTGQLAQVIYAREFVAAVDERGNTRVQVFNPDTVHHVLPVDTVMDIAVARQWFVWMRPLSVDTLSVSVTVEIDGRSVFDQSGGIFAQSPWSFVYAYNRLVAEVDEVTF